ncbi:rhodanese-like domain-containing protein [Nitrosophilus alvini]|uniref:rhodanese-like domain-containing protein n=1 Tax=Nitrosophilus alvini TaxID=2714855 RepID=UPI00190DCA0F|nr:rhodanese-like domain-containing protein [Nitrosophilus alvini]
MKNIIFLLSLLPILLTAGVKTLSVEEVEKLKKQKVPIIDIRTPQEWKSTGIIPGSRLIMFFDERGGYDLNRFMKEFAKVVPSKDMPFVLVCRTGSRTKVVGNFLADKLGYKKAADLGGGIYAWIRSKKPVKAVK